MKRKMKKKKIVFEAAGLLLAFMSIVGTGLQNNIIAEAQGINQSIVENIKYKDTPQLTNKMCIVLGNGEIAEFYIENKENFIGYTWEEERNWGMNGWFWDTDISMYLTYTMKMMPFWLTIIDLKNLKFYTKNSLPKYFTIKNFTVKLYWEEYSIPHGPYGNIYRIIGIVEGFQPN
jgi:hypothetical protein